MAVKDKNKKRQIKENQMLRKKNTVCNAVSTSSVRWRDAPEDQLDGKLPKEDGKWRLKKKEKPDCYTLSSICIHLLFGS